MQHPARGGHSFDREYWQRVWSAGDGRGASMASAPANPYLDRELSGLTPGTALDAGCGAGAEAIWLARAGWRVTAVDIASDALAHARARAEADSTLGPIRFVQADLGGWSPPEPFDLVTTHYAHPAMPQLELYSRIAEWVAPAGTLLIVGHAHGNGHSNGHARGHGHGHLHTEGSDDHPPAEASASAAGIVAVLDPAAWRIDAADEPTRTVARGGGDVVLRDVVVRATRRV